MVKQYPVFCRTQNDGDQEVQNGWVGCHAGITYSRFEHLMQLKYKLAPFVTPEFFFVIKKSDEQNGIERIPINPSTNFSALMQRHGESDFCYILADLRVKHSSGAGGGAISGPAGQQQQQQLQHKLHQQHHYQKQQFQMEALLKDSLKQQQQQRSNAAATAAAANGSSSSSGGAGGGDAWGHRARQLMTQRSVLLGAGGASFWRLSPHDRKLPDGFRAPSPFGAIGQRCM